MNVALRFRKHGWSRMFVALAIVLAAAIALAKPGTVQTRSGLTYSGDVVETTKTVTVTVNGVQTMISREDIASLVYDQRFEDEFKIQWSKLDAKDIKGRVTLAKSAIANKRLDLAAKILAEASQLNPVDEEVLATQDWLSRETRIARDRDRAADHLPSRLAKPAEPTPPPASAPSAPELPPGDEHPDTKTKTKAIGPVERQYLSPADIQIIRQNELRADDIARVQIPSEVRRSFASKSGMTFAEFNAKSPTEQATAILDSGDSQLKKQVKIASDPRALIEFKAIQRPILSGCASMQCHGGFNGGGLVLFNPADNEAATYTNFYVLARYSKKLSQSPNGMFGGPATVGLIERGHGEQSLLVQYGLSPMKAGTKHPNVAGYNGIFRDKNDAHAKQIIEWMDMTLRASSPDLDYKDISYKTPTENHSASTAPSTMPATAP